MSAEGLWSVQAAVYARLCADAALTALLAAGMDGVRDFVPPDATAPYLVLGDMDCRPHDTQEGGGHDIIMTLRCHSRGEGMKELRGIMAAVSAALHGADFAIAGRRLVLCREILATTQLEPDGVTRTGLQRFRIVTEPA